MRVCLPAPFCPSRPWISPRETLRSTRSHATTSPNRLVIPLSSTAATGEVEASPVRADGGVSSTMTCPTVQQPPGSLSLRSWLPHRPRRTRSEEHTSELQSLMRTSYAVFGLNTKQTPNSMTHLAYLVL